MICDILAMDVASFLLWSLAAFILYKVADHLLRQPRLRLAPGQTKHVLVTGCDSGFGNIFAKQLASRHSGYVVYAGCLTAAGRDALGQSGMANLKPIPLDITSEESISEAFRIVSTDVGQGKGLWAVVNNAGLRGAACPDEWLNKEEFTKVFDVNVFGVMAVCRAFLPLLKRSQGRIVNTASILGRLALPYAAPYVTSKHAVEGYSDGLRRELKAFNVSVHVVEPGYFTTALTNPANVGASLTRAWDGLDADMRAEYGEAFMDGMIQISAKLLPLISSPRLYLVTECYEHAVTAMFPRGRYMPGLDARLIYWPMSLAPEWFSDFILAVLPRLGRAEPAGAKKYRQ